VGKRKGEMGEIWLVSEKPVDVVAYFGTRIV